MSVEITYSLGRNRFDAYPQQCRAENLRDFAANVLRHRAQDKASAGYICAGFGGDGRRTGANALQRAWLAVDVDGIDPEAFVEWRLFLARYRGFGWATASSTPDAPRERVILELSEPVSRPQGVGIGALLTQDVGDTFGTAIRIDPCTYRPEQPAFLPLQGVRAFYLMGDALDVPAWLAQIPEPPPPPPPPTGDVVDMADGRMRWVVSRFGEAGLLIKELPNGRGYACVCPWTRRHTTLDAPGSCATVLLFPSEANGWHGAFRCLHAHCSQRRLGDVVRGLRNLERNAA